VKPKFSLDECRLRSGQRWRLEYLKDALPFNSLQQMPNEAAVSAWEIPHGIFCLMGDLDLCVFDNVM